MQLAVSLDYSVFLIHRFEECRGEKQNVKEAMVEALCKSTSSILSSGLTTVIGFLALVLMKFRIGPDLGLALAKGVAISLITVFVFMPALVLTVYKLLDQTRHKKLLPGFHRFGKVVRRIAIHTLPQITSIISYVDLAGAEIPMEYLDEDTLSQLVSENYSRMVLSVKASYEGEETFKLVEKIRSIAESYYPGAYYLAGEGVSTYDLMQTVTADMVKVNIVAIAAVFLVLLMTLKSLSPPIILVLSIESAIWINLAVPYFMGSTVFYIAYLIISSIQLGATVDYAILMTDRYKENRQTLGKKDAVVETISNVTVSILWKNYLQDSVQPSDV